MSTSHLSLQPHAKRAATSCQPSPPLLLLLECPKNPSPNKDSGKNRSYYFCKSSMKFRASARAVYNSPSELSFPAPLHSPPLSSHRGWWCPHPQSPRLEKKPSPHPHPQPACWFLRQHVAKESFSISRLPSGGSRAASSTGQHLGGAGFWGIRRPEQQAHARSDATGVCDPPSPGSDGSPH